jgi:hypothetical protein
LVIDLNTQETYYQEKLNPLQDKVLSIVQESGAAFYLTGGTALSRFYLQHRFSEDLDLFLNAHSEFKSQCQLVLDAFDRADLDHEISTGAPSFLRIFLNREDVTLKIDLVNDVPFHYGQFASGEFFHKIDNWRNILSNKLCSISRSEPKDMADIIGIAKASPFSWVDLIKEAQEKDAWIEPLSICQIMESFPIESFNQIKWIVQWDPRTLQQDLKTIHRDIFYGRVNSLCCEAKTHQQ